MNENKAKRSFKFDWQDLKILIYLVFGHWDLFGIWDLVIGI
jgi:hypothetical protein